MDFIVRVTRTIDVWVRAENLGAAKRLTERVVEIQNKSLIRGSDKLVRMRIKVVGVNMRPAAPVNKTKERQ
jgi:hypothetical protein